MNPVELHPFEMQLEEPGTDGQTVYTRRFQAPRRLIILGCGYVAQSLCHFASQLEFDIYAADDRPSFANPYTMTNAKEVICDSFPAAIEQMDPHPLCQWHHTCLYGAYRFEKTCCRTF